MVSKLFTFFALIVFGGSVCGAPPPATIEQIESWIVAKPSPQYPPEALARREAGSGVIKLHFRIKTGTVRTSGVAQSTGYKDLDAAAIKAFSQWRFKAGVLPPIRSFNPHTKEPFADEDFVAKIPVTFTLASGGRVSTAGLGAPR